MTRSQDKVKEDRSHLSEVPSFDPADWCSFKWDTSSGEHECARAKRHAGEHCCYMETIPTTCGTVNVAPELPRLS